MTSIFELIRLSFAALKERKLRSGLTIMMVIMGAALMTSVHGLGGGMDNFFTEQFGSLGANVLIVTPSGGGGGFGRPQSSSTTMKLTSGTVQTIEKIHGVTYAVPYVSGVASLKSAGEEKTMSVVGIDQNKLKYIAPKISLESGSYVSTQDSIGILLGYNVAHPSDLDRPFAKRGQTISIEYTTVETERGTEKTETKSFQVKGIIEELGNLQIDNQAYISPSAANALFDKGGSYNGIYAITRDPEENDAVEESIRKIYGKNIGVTSPKAITSTIQESLGAFTGFISAIAGVSMFVGAVGIITTLYTSVMERTREIGLLKALGCGKRNILFMFLSESMTIGFIGGLLGLLLGLGGAYALIAIMPFGRGGMSFTPYFVPINLLQIFILSFTLSIIAGLYPAWRASKLTPIEALRKE
ncbi:ABC transporter permease [Candidatus Bathyarchaeota archaeon]|jgi:putative ABC transport system permease protein|nr:ABC transporter permease [Candidatus Bathyarchaeota archaeon]